MSMSNGVSRGLLVTVPQGLGCLRSHLHMRSQAHRSHVDVSPNAYHFALDSFSSINLADFLNQVYTIILVKFFLVLMIFFCLCRFLIKLDLSMCHFSPNNHSFHLDSYKVVHSMLMQAVMITLFLFLTSYICILSLTIHQLC